MKVSGPGCMITEDMLAILTPLIQKCVSSKHIFTLYYWNANELHEDPAKQMGVEINYHLNF
jgi:hypothetical protein